VRPCYDGISRIEALGIAAAYLLSIDVQEFDLADVRTLKEWLDSGVRAPFVYNHSLENDWIVLLRRRVGVRIESSMAVCIDRDTGKVTYYGSLNDEG
jgi:hypothetical protein